MLVDNLPICAFSHGLQDRMTLDLIEARVRPGATPTPVGCGTAVRMWCRRPGRAFLAGALIAILAVQAPIAALAQTVVVGGKGFTEQLLMAEMTSQLLTAKGLSVETRSGFDTTSLRKAQETGVVDLYWEYTGTSLSEFNKVTEKLSPAETYARVKQLDMQKGLVWLPPSRVNNTYALAMRRADALERRIATISDLAATVLRGERLTFASGAEFYDRSDGLGPLQQAYGFQFGRERVVRLDPDRVYEVLRDLKLIDVGMVFATDGRIAAYDLLVLKDDKEFFPNYAMVPVVRKQSLERHPNLVVYLGSLAAALDTETMARLNGLIDVRGNRISEVVSEFLRSRGLL
jgi:osmoprotectant transport system substrate-binding protein